MSNQVRLAMVGCGNIAEVHVNGFEQLYKGGCRDFIYSACCSKSESSALKMARKIAAIQGSMPAVFTDTALLAKAKVADGADVCLPHYLHHTIVCQLLEAGLHVMVEKPIGITIKANRLMIDCAKKTNRILATGEHTRRNLSSRAWAWALKEEKIAGDIVSVYISLINHDPFDWNRGLLKWRGIKLLGGGGMIFDSGAHFCDMQRILFGEPAEASCWMATLDKRTITDAPVIGAAPVDVEDTFHATIRFQSGVRTSWSYSRELHNPGLSFAHYYGTKGTAQDTGFPFHCFESGGTITFSDGSVRSNDSIIQEYLLQLDGDLRKKIFPFGCTDGFGVEVWDFADSIRNNRKPEIDGEEGLRSKALAITCYESAVAGRPVAYADVLSGKVSAYQDPINSYWKI